MTNDIINLNKPPAPPAPPPKRILNEDVDLLYFIKWLRRMMKST